MSKPPKHAATALVSYRCGHTLYHGFATCGLSGEKYLRKLARLDELELSAGSLSCPGCAMAERSNQPRPA